MGAKFSDGKTLYDKLSPYENEVFLRYQYRTVDGVTLDDDQSYCITDVEFRVQYGVSNLRFQHSDLAVYEGWTGQLMPLVNVDQTIAYDSLEWNTSDSNVVSITDNYKLVANNKGTAIISAKLKGDNTVYARCIINVSEYKEAVILLHGRSDNSTYVFGASNAIGIGNDKDHDDNDNYNSSIYAVTANNKSYTNVEDQLIQDNNGIKSIFNGYYEGGSVKDYDGEEYDGNLAEYLINEKGYEANINLFIFNYPNEDAVVHNAMKFRVFIDNLMTYVRNNESEKMRRSFYPNSTSDPNSFKFSLVGHSMGGLVSRYYIENCTNIEHYHNNSHNGSACQYNDNHVSKLITIDTPHWGSGLADISCVGGIIDISLHYLCDHDLALGSAMYGGNNSIIKDCNARNGVTNYRFTETLNYTRTRETKYYAIAGIDYNSDGMNVNNHAIELMSSYATYSELSEEIQCKSQNNLYSILENTITLVHKAMEIRNVGDNVVSFLSQIGWTDNISASPLKTIDMEKIYIIIDTDGGNAVGKTNHFHGKMPHREPVMTKVSEYLGE